MTKRGIQLATILTAMGAPLLITGIAAADTTTTNCSIYTTGTDSYNACVANNSNQNYVTCVNDIYTVYSNTQTSTSGNTSVTNSSAGNVSSGSAVNASGNTVTVGASCAPATTTTTTTPTPPATPGTGAGTTPTAPTATTTSTPAPTPTVTKPAATVLPETGNNDVTEGAVIGLVSLAGLLAVAKIGMSVARRSMR